MPTKYSKKDGIRRVRTTDIPKMIQVRRVLTMEDLRSFWEKYRRGMKRSSMIEYFGITEEQCTEALEAAQLIWGRKPSPEKKEALLKKIQEIRDQALEEEEYEKPSPPLRDGGKRPPAEYSNKSPYGVARPGIG